MATKANKTPVTQAVNPDNFDSVSSFDEAVSVLEDLGVAIHNAEDLSDNDFIVVDQATLVGVPFLVLSARMNQGKFGDFLTFHAITKDGRKVIVNDGSTGLKRQALALGSAFVGSLHQRGLRISEYTYEDDQGGQIAAKTYYFAAL